MVAKRCCIHLASTMVHSTLHKKKERTLATYSSLKGTKVCTKQWNWSYEELLHTLLLPTLQMRCKIMKLLLLYKYVNNLAYFSEPPLVQRQLCYLTRASHSCHLQYLNGHTCQYLFSFFPHSVRMWNELPGSLPCCNSVSTFQHCLCKHFK